VGITLTAADTVIFIDRSWSPAVNLQAEDRLHRIGQKNAVQVILLDATHTIDEGVTSLLREKWHMIQRVLDGAPDVRIVE
jgi:SNF2 family DNA or RNA helicase